MSLIQFKDISKSFQHIQACAHVTINIEAGSIHSIVGENGAGKSTLMKLLGGIQKPSSGTMQLNGKPYSPESALDAFENKIAFIHQHFVLARQMTAFENILLSCSSSMHPFNRLPLSVVRTKTEFLLKKFNWRLNLDVKVENISVGEQQRLEILKALLLEPEIFIFDEPTAVLTPQESENILDFLLQLKKEKKTILLISHKLNEIKKVSDQVTIMREGRVVVSEKNESMTLDQMAEKIIGRKLQKTSNKDRVKKEREVLFNLKQNSIPVFKSEIFGIAGIEGHGQGQLIQEMLVKLKQLNLTFGDITEDRIALSVFQDMNLTEHFTLKHSKQVTDFGIIKKGKATHLTTQLLKKWDVRPQIAECLLSELSGGNQQKFIVGRELFHNPEVLIAAHPTRGVDLGAQEFIHKALLEYVDQEKTVFLISSDLDEVLSLSDRFVILHNEKLFGPFLKNSLTEIQIGQYMLGQQT